MQIDINIVGALGLVLTGFGIYMRLTIKSAISDLKDSLGSIYVLKSECELSRAAIEAKMRAIATVCDTCAFRRQNHVN